MDDEIGAVFNFDFEYPFRILKKPLIVDMKRISNSATLRSRLAIFSKYKKENIDDDYCILLTFMICLDFNNYKEQDLVIILDLVRPIVNSKYSPANIALVAYFMRISDILDLLDNINGAIFNDLPAYKSEYQLFYRFYYYQNLKFKLSKNLLHDAETNCRLGMSITTKSSQFSAFLVYAVIISWFKGKFFKEKFLNQYLPKNHCIRVLNFYIRNIEYSKALKLLHEYATEFNKNGLYLFILFNLKFLCLHRALAKLKLKCGGQEKYSFTFLKEFWNDCFERVELINSLAYLFGNKIISGQVLDENDEFIIISDKVDHYIVPNYQERQEKEPSECLQKMLLLKEEDVFPMLDFENEFLKEQGMGFE
eukprot:NODE_380_length_9674_cov_0.149452.p4 type:complete len:365 gc:universal NODE_380_length_9674_cov_0.149452:1795-2889(+)